MPSVEQRITDLQNTVDGLMDTIEHHTATIAQLATVNAYWNRIADIFGKRAIAQLQAEEAEHGIVPPEPPRRLRAVAP